MKRPWFSFYAYDWLTDANVCRMTLEERGLYIQLLAYQWTEGGIHQDLIDDGYAIARICGVSRRKFASVWTTVRERFELGSDSVHRSVRLESERNRADKFSEEQSNRAKTGWVKRAGALPPGKASDSTSQHITAQEKPPADAGGDDSGNGHGSKRKPPDQLKLDTDALCEKFKASWVALFKPSDSKPPRVQTADYMQAKALVKSHGLPEASRLVDVFLADRDAFLLKTGHAMRHLAGRVDGYRATTRATTRGRLEPVAHSAVTKREDL